MANRNQPSLRAVAMSLYPTMNSLDEVVALAKSKLPVTSHNDLISLLMTYHNTLLKEFSNAS